MEDTPKSQKKRLRYWVALAVFSAISLGSVVQASKQLDHSAAINFLIAVAAITMSIATVCALAVARRALFLLKYEMYSAAVSLIFWSIGIGIMFHKTGLVQVAQGGFVNNANLYYFSWAALISAILLSIELLKLKYEIDLGSAMENSGKRFMDWAILCVSSFVVMASAAGHRRDANCPSGSGLQYYAGDVASYCQSVNMSIAFGVIIAVFALAMLAAAHLLKRNLRLKLIAEGVSSLIATVFYAILTAYSTSPGRAGSAIGNLYYFTWISFIVSAMLLLDCFREFRVGAEAPSDAGPSKAEQEDQA